MKKLIILLLCVILLSSCDAPVTVPERSNQLVADYDALKTDYNALLLECEKKENASTNLTALRNTHNKLINDYHALQTQYVILEAYSQTIREQYNALLPQIGKTSADKDKAMKELAQQYAIVENRYRLITNQLDAVHKENVSILSDNLTDIEYNAFYKGWKLWWGEFNE